MRNVMISLLVSLVVVAPAKAQESQRADEAAVPLGIVDSAVRNALRMELQPTTQRVVTGGNRGMFWTGIAMMAGGGTLAALSTNVLSAEVSACFSDECYDPIAVGSNTNAGVLYGGLGIAASGAVLALMNRGQQRQARTIFFPTRRGGAVFRTLTF